MRHLLIASLLVLTTPGTVGAASPSPVPSVSPSASPSAAPVPVPLPGELRINEFLPNPVGTDTGNEWVELANVSNHDVAAGGLVVARLASSTLVTVPAGTVFKAGEVLLLAQLSGSIVNGGDTVILKSGQTELDRVTYDGAGQEGWSWSRISATEGAWSSVPTPGTANPAEVPITDPGDDDSSVGSGSATTASTKASAATAEANPTAAAKKAAAKKLANSGLNVPVYLGLVGLAMILAKLYGYVRRRLI